MVGGRGDAWICHGKRGLGQVPSPPEPLFPPGNCRSGSGPPVNPSSRFLEKRTVCPGPRAWLAHSKHHVTICRVRAFPQPVALSLEHSDQWPHVFQHSPWDRQLESSTIYVGLQTLSPSAPEPCAAPTLHLPTWGEGRPGRQGGRAPWNGHWRDRNLHRNQPCCPGDGSCPRHPRHP